jgi:arylsulfatase A-like enzyme
LYATLLDYAEVEIPAHCQGTSLRPRLEGRATSRREALYGALYPLAPTEVLTDPARDAYALWARSERWKFILSLKDLTARADAGSGEGEREDIKVSLAPDFHRRRGEVELYDLERDPHERTNLALDPAHDELLKSMRRDVLAWWQATGGGALELP